MQFLAQVIVENICVSPSCLQKVILHHRHECLTLLEVEFEYGSYKLNKSYSKLLSFLQGCKMFLILSEAS